VSLDLVNPLATYKFDIWGNINDGPDMVQLSCLYLGFHGSLPTNMIFSFLVATWFGIRGERHKIMKVERREMTI